jgi:rsbT antagonist protein RsbS
MRPYFIFPIGDAVLVALQEEIDDDGIASLLVEVTRLVKERSAHGVVVDLGAVEVVDTYLARHVERLASTLLLLDAEVVVSGLSVPAVMTLLDFDIRLEGLSFAREPEQAIARFAPQPCS